ncbi:hypothetical protein SCALIN_C44_0006 [Candidatus Scalindua japonica]|uniref:Uncharacterized protein n=1 Tax=Candidatus Scalindua japonica TaxID=1284222 RepID=A0A286U3X1_9BACT|nr:hypothetical protein SCALIN_C44_0006 [Candidatus Scalindua japonica]
MKIITKSEREAKAAAFLNIPLSKSRRSRNIFKNRIQLKISVIVNGGNLVTSTKVNRRPPMRLPMASRIYTKPMSEAESRVNPLITLQPKGKINPIVKLNGVMIHIDEISNDNRGMY